MNSGVPDPLRSTTPEPSERAMQPEPMERTVPIEGLTVRGALPVYRAAPRSDIPGLTVIDPDNYVIESEVARGGMGVILAARDRRLSRPVAIKQVLANNEVTAARFEREARITARLQHPSIVNIYEAGQWPNGVPFYAMKMVTGESLAKVISRCRTFADRLALVPNVLAVAEALAYAHSQRIIHRDLKPENVLMGSFGETVVIDWGLAKDLAAEVTDGEMVVLPSPSPLGGTLAGAVMGTPATMAPEQARGKHVDERADVYALGAILYQVLAGSPPYQGGSYKSVIRKVLTRPPVPLPERAPNVSKELRAIVEKAMARDPEERYPTANEFAEELKRFQTGRLVAAHRYSTWDLMRRWLRRNKAMVAVVVAALGVLVLVTIVSFRTIIRERRQAIERADDMTLLEARSSLDRDAAASLDWLRSLSPGSARWREGRVIAADALSRGIPRVLHGHEGAVTSLAFSPDGKTLATASADRTVRLWQVGAGGGGDARVLSGHEAHCSQVAFSPDGSLLASASHDQTVRLWDLASGEDRVLRGHLGFVSQLAFSPDGKTVASGGKDATVRLWDVSTGQSRVLRGHQAQVRRLQFSPYGDLLASASEDATVRIWDAATGESRALRHERQVLDLSFSPDGKTLVSGGEDGTVRLWDLDMDENRILRGHEGTVWTVTFSPDGKLMASGSEDGTARLWDIATGQSRILPGHAGSIIQLSFSPDGKRLASASHDSNVRLWDSGTGESLVFRGHSLWVYQIAFSPDGQTLASAGGDRSVRLWGMGVSQSTVLRGHQGAVRQAFFRSGGKLVVSAGGDDDTIRLWTLPSGTSKVVQGIEGRQLGLSRGGEKSARISFDGTVHVLDTLTGESRALSGHEGDVQAIAFSADGTSIATASFDRTLRIWSLTTAETQVVSLGKSDATNIDFSPDGGSVAFHGDDPSVHLWDRSTGRETVWRGHEGNVKDLTFSPDGQLVASAGADKTVRLWSVAGAAGGVKSEPLVLRGHDGFVTCVAFSPDGKLLASGSADRTLRLWEVAAGAKDASRVLEGHLDIVRHVTFSPDGTRLASASSDKTVRLWDVATGEGRELRGHDDRVGHVAFSADGTMLVSSSKDGTVRVWKDDLPLHPEGLRRWLDESATARGR